jgi:hypothetical protein
MDGRRPAWVYTTRTAAGVELCSAHFFRHVLPRIFFDATNPHVYAIFAVTFPGRLLIT